MHEDIANLIHKYDGIIRRSDALDLVDHRTLERAVRADHLHAPFPRVYLPANLASDRRALMRAAIVHADGAAALSHTSALHVWQLPIPAHGPIHLTPAVNHHFRGNRSLRVHRRHAFSLGPPNVVIRDDLPVIRLERTIIDSWPLLHGDAKRDPAIMAVAGRMTTPERLTMALQERPRLGGRRELERLIDLLAAGCRSHLELWGYQQVFTGPEFASVVWQYPVRIDGRVVYLDGLDLTTGTNFELDGARHHRGPGDRERDLRRDAALQALGMVVVRFTGQRLYRQPATVRRDAVAIMRSRPSGWTLPASARVLPWPRP
jgi:hypothetical protein